MSFCLPPNRRQEGSCDGAGRESDERATHRRASDRACIDASIRAGPKYVYSFAGGKAEGSSALRNLLGGKGCELAEMTNLGMPVPPGFTITTQAWAAYDATRQEAPGRALDPGRWRISPGSRPPRAPARRPASGRCWCRSARARAPRCPA